jgi:CBS domain containing-hemolysin-like protein
MTALVLSILLTLGLSFTCSLLEAFILSTTVADIESLKKRRPRMGMMLERFRESIDMTSSAILTLNTVANTLGASVVGMLATAIFADDPELHFMLWAVPAFMVVAILLFSEIIPKNIGVAYRRELQGVLVYPLLVVRTLMWPVAALARLTIKGVISHASDDEKESEAEILLLADRQARQGALSPGERDMIANALSLDDVSLSQIMTPRTVVAFVEAAETVQEVSRRFKVIPFARMPVVRDGIDQVTGMVRRRDIMQAAAEDREGVAMESIMTPMPVIPDTASCLDALQLFLREHQQMALVVDEFGATAGVVTMEDVVERLLGREIYENTDLAIDMRELARSRAGRDDKRIRGQGGVE